MEKWEKQAVCICHSSANTGGLVYFLNFQLSRYTDFLLRRTGKGLTDPELEKRLSNAIIIFKYIEDKDMFQKVRNMFFFTLQICIFSVLLQDVGESADRRAVDFDGLWGIDDQQTEG